MMKNKIDEINAAVEETAATVRDDERIFQLGVELGRYLAATDEKFERLEFFIRREEERHRDERVREKRKKIGELISKLFYWACAKQIQTSGSIKFDVDEYWRGSLNLFDANIVEEFGVQCKSVTQENEDQDFEIEYEVVGKVGEIFEKYEARKMLWINAYNLHSSTSLTLTNSMELGEAVGKSWMSFDRSGRVDDEKKLDELMDELNKATLMIQLKYSGT